MGRLSSLLSVSARSGLWRENNTARFSTQDRPGSLDRVRLTWKNWPA